MDKPYIIEYCTDDLNEALSKQHLYDQLEFCSNLNLEGLTPSVEEVKYLMANTNKRVKIMIRSYEPNFEHHEASFDTMCEEAKSMYEIGVRNFVFGTLRAGRLDIDQLTRFTSILPDSRICVHKAIDVSLDIVGDVAKLSKVQQVDEILSSGGGNTALEGLEVLMQMQKIFKGTIIAAGKITKENLNQITFRSGLKAYHGRRII